jgi:VIT1/CCC1 family predicted Fe2+/Mn2+ transporter
MKQTFKTGLCFGTTTGIITTLGLMVGVESGTKSVLAVLGAVLIIAIADAFSDSFGMHISQESEAKKSRKQVWESTLSTFVSKIFIGFTFIVPILLFDLQTAIILSILWAIILLSALNFYMAKEKGVNPWSVITQHVGIALIVVVITHFIGEWISLTFV